jgi:hypothetical protein
MIRVARAVRGGVGAALLAAGCGFHAQAYLPASHNWAFRTRYPAVDGLFNAFDYGHAVLSEVLLTRSSRSAVELDAQFSLLTQRILVHPPRVPLDVSAIGPGFAKLAPEINLMFEWAHMLHRQVYDVWADERIAPGNKDAQVARVLRYYRSRRDLAFSALPKSMDLMEGQPYSTSFRKAHPRFNGLIWSYHWLQVGLYDALIVEVAPEDRARLVSDLVSPEDASSGVRRSGHSRGRW